MKNEFNAMRTDLANQFAEAGAALLDYMGTGGALAAIPDTDPPRYAVAGTLDIIGKLLPAACPFPPAAPSAASIEGLTDAQIEKVWEQLPLTGAYSMVEARIKFARAIERLLATQSAKQGAQASELRAAVRQMTLALASGEWADLLTTDKDAAALEVEIQRALEAWRAEAKLGEAYKQAAWQATQAAPEQADMSDAEITAAAAGIYLSEFDDAMEYDIAVARAVIAAMKSKRAASTDGDQKGGEQ